MGRATYPEVVSRASQSETRAFERATLNASLFGLALRGVCLAAIVLPHALVRSYFNSPHRTATAPFHPSPATFIAFDGERTLAGLFSVALVVTRLRAQKRLLSPLQFPPRAQPLAGSLPYSVRTFLSHETSIEISRQRPPDLLSCKAKSIVTNHCSTRTAQKQFIVEPDLTKITSRGIFRPNSIPPFHYLPRI